MYTHVRHNFWKVSSNSEQFKKNRVFCGFHGNGGHFEVFNPQKLPHTTVDIPTKFHEVWWKESKTIFNPPFFVSMVAVAKSLQLIPICLAYLVPLDVDVVPNKFHQLISKPQNYVYTCQTKFLESFIQFRAL